MSTIPTEREREQLRTLRRQEADLVDALATLGADLRVLVQRIRTLRLALKAVRADIRDLADAA